MMAEPANIDEYISFQNDSAKVMLAKMRQIINAVAKDADEIISYNMPALKYKGRILVYYAGFQNHCSLFPANSSLIADLKEELKNYKTSKGLERLMSSQGLLNSMNAFRAMNQLQPYSKSMSYD